MGTNRAVEISGNTNVAKVTLNRARFVTRVGSGLATALVASNMEAVGKPDRSGDRVIAFDARTRPECRSSPKELLLLDHRLENGLEDVFDFG